MYDFNNIMVSLGIEAESVINAFNVCTAIIEETQKLASEIGFENDADALLFDFDGNYPDDAFANAVKLYLMDGIRKGKVQDGNLTAHIVTSCYAATFGLLEQTELFKTLDARFYGAMPLVFQCGDKMSDLGNIEDLDTACAEEISSALSNAVVDKLDELEGAL